MSTLQGLLLYEHTEPVNLEIMRTLSVSMAGHDTHISLLDGKAFTVFKVNCKFKGVEFICKKRFSEFVKLNAADDFFSLFKQLFPPKHLYNNMDESKVSRRESDLQKWFTAIVDSFKSDEDVLVCIATFHC